MLKVIRNPKGQLIRFEYDALGRRTAKIVSDDLGLLILDRPEPTHNVTTWLYEDGSLVPTAKISDGNTYSIVSDYLGRPAQAYDEKGKLVWQVEFDIYGRIREDSFNNKHFLPFRQLGQYEDEELGGLYYNRFRYYDSNSGTYISKDPIGLAGNNPNLYAYTHDSNSWVDVFGLSGSECGGAISKEQGLLKAQTALQEEIDNVKKLSNNKKAEISTMVGATDLKSGNTTVGIKKEEKILINVQKI